MTRNEKLSVLRCRLSVPLKCDDCDTEAVCPMSDNQLDMLLSQCGDNLDEASYQACIRLADCDSIKLADGTTLESRRKYWLSLARLFRAGHTRCIPRADEGCST